MRVEVLMFGLGSILLCIVSSGDAFFLSNVAKVAKKQDAMQKKMEINNEEFERFKRTAEKKKIEEKRILDKKMKDVAGKSSSPTQKMKLKESEKRMKDKEELHRMSKLKFKSNSKPSFELKKFNKEKRESKKRQGVNFSKLKREKKTLKLKDDEKLKNTKDKVKQGKAKSKDQSVSKHATAEMKRGTTPEDRRRLKNLHLMNKRSLSDWSVTRTKDAFGMPKRSVKHSEEEEDDWLKLKFGDSNLKSNNADEFDNYNEIGAVDAFTPLTVAPVDFFTAVDPPAVETGRPEDFYTAQDTEPGLAINSAPLDDIVGNAVDDFEEPFEVVEEPEEPELTEEVVYVNLPDSDEIEYEVETYTDISKVPALEESSSTPPAILAVTTTPTAAAAPSTTEEGQESDESSEEEKVWPWQIYAEGEEPCGRAHFGQKRAKSRSHTMTKILQGKEALPGSFPWQVAILDADRDLYCGGTLIAPRWVLTASHCVKKKLYVRLSEHHIFEKDGREIEQKVRRVFKHPDYNASTIDNDIALLRLPALPAFRDNATGLVSRGVTDRACLPSSMDEFPAVGTRCMVMGWGKASMTHRYGTETLMYTKLPIISRKACRRANKRTITENMFCAGHYKGGADTCSGDSGGPLMCSDGTKTAGETWTVHGVTSFGDGCGVAGQMGVYAKVDKYLDWMAGIMNRYL